MNTNASDDHQIIEACKAAIHAYELSGEYRGNVSASEHRRVSTGKQLVASWEAGENQTYQQYQDALNDLRRLLSIPENAS